jgi:RNA polymerase sigma-70 factor, ECF subfamily
MAGSVLAAANCSSELVPPVVRENTGVDTFEDLFALHHGRVYQICFKMTRDHATAEDLAQEAKLQVFRKIHTFRGKSAFSTWLHRLTTNVVLMHIRRTGGKTRLTVPLEGEFGIDSDAAPPRQPTIIDHHLRDTVDRVNLERAIGGLAPGYRRVFLLHDLAGYDHAEIARLMNCSSGNSKSQLHKARRKMRTLLTEGGQNGGPPRQPQTEETMSRKSKVDLTEIVRANLDKSNAEIAALIRQAGGEISRGYIYRLKRQCREGRERPSSKGSLPSSSGKDGEIGQAIAALDRAIAETAARLSALKKAREALEGL